MVVNFFSLEPSQDQGKSSSFRITSQFVEALSNKQINRQTSYYFRLEDEFLEMIGTFFQIFVSRNKPIVKGFVTFTMPSE